MSRAAQNDRFLGYRLRVAGAGAEPVPRIIRRKKTSIHRKWYVHA